jgi:hypothetical protein
MRRLPEFVMYNQNSNPNSKPNHGQRVEQMMSVFGVTYSIESDGRFHPTAAQLRPFNKFFLGAAEANNTSITKLGKAIEIQINAHRK